MRTMHWPVTEIGDFNELELDLEIPDNEWLPSKTARSRPIAPGSAIPPYTQCDFIHPNIDVSAQYALYGMLKADPASRNASVQMLAAVKTGRLGGIFQEDQKVPALRAIKLGLGWYGPLINKYRKSTNKYRKSTSSAACIPPTPHPSHRLDKLEIISFRKSLAKNTAELGRQLRDVWLDCAASKSRLPPVQPRGGVCSRPKPLPPPPPKITPERSEPELCVEPSVLQLIDDRDRFNPNGKKVIGTLSLRSCGGGEFRWTIFPTEPRLTLDPMSGLARGRVQRINVTWDTVGLRANKRYSAWLHFYFGNPKVPKKVVVEVELLVVGFLF